MLDREHCPKRREQKRLAAVKWRARNREKCRARGRANYAKHAEARKAYARRRRDEDPQALTLMRSINRYGLTIDQFHAFMERQDFGCAICARELSGRRALQIDHDHVTGRVRGVLCMGCNLGLGMFREHPERLRAAIAYLS